MNDERFSQNKKRFLVVLLVIKYCVQQHLQIVTQMLSRNYIKRTDPRLMTLRISIIGQVFQVPQNQTFGNKHGRYLTLFYQFESHLPSSGPVWQTSFSHIDNIKIIVYQSIQKLGRRKTLFIDENTQLEKHIFDALMQCTLM